MYPQQTFIDPNMKSYSAVVSALCLSLATLPLTLAGPLATRNNSPTPTRPFTVSAFQSPYPIGQGITGLNMTAHGGNFYLSPDPKGEPSTSCRCDSKAYCAPVKKAVLFVNGEGEAYLVRSHPPSLLRNLQIFSYSRTNIAVR